jgi:transcriptional regulator with XRE-family HTH domain
MTTPEELDASVLLLGDWLARWRTAVGVSQRVLADRAGISQSGLSRLERGLQVVGARRLARIIDTLDRMGGGSVMGPIGPPPFRRQPVDGASDVDALHLAADASAKPSTTW